MRKVLFVSGIDTNIGKTYATAMLLDKFSNEGLRVTSQKMIQTGDSKDSEDILLHRKLTKQMLREEDLNHTTAPIILSYPASPHLAAKIDQREIDMSIIDQARDRLFDEYNYELILLEGAGGLMVPITEDFYTIDFIQERNYPLALVTSGRLGSLNHTFLSLELCRTRGIELEYLVYNHFPTTDKLIEADSLEMMNAYIGRHFPKAKLIELFNQDV